MISRAILVGQCMGVVALWAFAPAAGAQDSAASKSGRRAAAAAAPNVVPVASLAGQTVSVLPLTLVVADSMVERDTAYAKYRDRYVALAWADSAVGNALTARGPEVQWRLPAELAGIARRAPGVVEDPKTYGQAVLRSPRYKKDLPDQLAANLRNLVAVAGGRLALVPAALFFTHAANGHGVRADLPLVLVDARGGKVVWRTVVTGSGATPGAALEAAMTAALPLESTP